MARRTGTADLPLHYGSVPKWLSERMARLAGVLVEAIILQYGRAELLRRLAHPFWFQSFGAVMGMDWHSSGITTSAVWALKRALADAQWDLGVHVCGGRGSHSRHTPQELRAIGQRTGIDGQRLGEISRLVAKVDSAAVQDGFNIYLHTFVVTDDGDWTVIQQGMNTSSQLARRYHWLSEGLRSFVDAPHAAIEGRPTGTIVNLTDHRAARARELNAKLAREDPDRVLRELRRMVDRDQPSLFQTDETHLRMPPHHDVWPTDVSMKRLRANLAAAAKRGPRDFTELLLTPGVGPRTVFALSLVAEVIHGAPSRFADPARFSFAHGGKDGHPFPVPLKIYDETLRVLRRAVDRARLGNDDKLAALRALDRESRRVADVAGPSFNEIVSREQRISASLDGRVVGRGAAAESAPGLAGGTAAHDGRTVGRGPAADSAPRIAAGTAAHDGRTVGRGPTADSAPRIAAGDTAARDGRIVGRGPAVESMSGAAGSTAAHG